MAHNLTGFAALLAHIAVEVDGSQREALKRAAEILEEDAKDAIGSYRYGWPQLAEATKRDRVAKGFPENEPLLRTGEFRDSIGHVVVGDSDAYVGTNDARGKLFELGTRHMPPRPVFGGAVMAKGPEIREEFANIVMKVFTT